MDGTIVDTEPYWMDAEQKLVAQYGGAWTHEQALALVGLALDDSARILQDAGVAMSTTDILDSLTATVSRRLAEDGVPYRPGAAELLAALNEAGVPCALVTMSLRSMAMTVVDRMPAGTFDVVVAGDDVTRGKPFPDPYLQAAAELGVRIEDCLAIEDSPNGLRSAVASQATTLGVPHMVSLEGVGADALWPTLAGRTPADLTALHISRGATR